MYSMTSIFRTETGFLPGYGIAPAEPGTYTLEKELIIISEDKLYPITEIEVFKQRPGLVIATRRGHYPVIEEAYQGELVYSIDNAPMSLADPRKTIDDEYVVQCAFYAGCWLSGLTWQQANAKIRKLAFPEIRSKNISLREFFGGRRYILDFSKLKKQQVYSWLYHTLIIMHRAGGLYTPKWDVNVHMNLSRVWWRDMLLAILHNLNADFSIKLKSHAVYDLSLSREEMRRCMARMLATHFTRSADDFAFADAVVTKTEVILDKDGKVFIVDEEDIPDKINKVQVQSKLSEFSNILIAFPQIQDKIEVNGLIF